ncbi:MAG: MFS transporter [Gammaproteobacteria bacterium]|nr:MFS transporter [Gammaproteobacteria bacterium]
MIGKQKNVVLAGAIGNALEWYDFTIYAFFVPIIATQFFPNKDPFVSLLATFGVFAVGFLVRPLGAVLFGYIGDHAGRKKALVVSMIMMSFPTFFIGLLPNYEHIGLMAPMLLIALRIIQGLAVSGELTTATVFLIEHADKNRRGIAGSLAMSGALGGMVLSALFASLISELVGDANLVAWGWRIPFLMGGLIGVIGLIIRLNSVDPAVYQEVQVGRKEKVSRASVKNHVTSLNYRTLYTGIFLTSLMATSNYFLIGFFNTFLMKTMGMPMRPVMLINTIAITVLVILTLLMGRLSDYVGRKPVLGAGIVCMAAFSYPIFWLLTQHDIYLALCGELLFALAAGALTGLIPTTLAEMFDTYHRNMGISISYNISLALFGGTAPLIAITLVASTNQLFAPAWYLMGCATLAFLALLTVKESYQKPFVV